MQDGDHYTLNTLIIPKQNGTSDTCDTVGEEDVVAYQIEHDLISLGWVHTHPTQECFLSSVDVHTHYGYQAMLKEAIAVVLAPKFNPK
jgi:STAM-binding protein